MLCENMNYNKIVGEFGEKLAREFLLKRGYEIIEKNIKLSYREIDIIAKKNNDLIFIEVKTRTTNKFGGADESVYMNKIESLKNAVENYLENLDKNFYNDLRIDLIAVNVDKVKKIANIKHYKAIV